jgi:hypothetical protein
MSIYEGVRGQRVVIASLPVVFPTAHFLREKTEAIGNLTVFGISNLTCVGGASEGS